MQLLSTTLVLAVLLVTVSNAVKFKNVALNNELANFVHYPHKTITEHYDPVKTAPGAPFPFTSRPRFPDDGELDYFPMRGYGRNGAALVDFDGDGDLDIYLTNAYGHENKLYLNLLEECGEMDFVDVTSEMCADLSDHDSAATCFGDFDNDGLDDIVVMGHDSTLESGIRVLHGKKRAGHGKPMRKGNCRFRLKSTFEDISRSSGILRDGYEEYTPSSCTIADFNADGKLDLYATTAWKDMTDGSLIFNYEEERLSHNMLFMQSDTPLVFTEEAEVLGLQAQELLGITWAAGAADYDGDGDVDLFAVEDQAASFNTQQSEEFGIDRGFVRIFKNRLIEDGALSFEDVTLENGIPPADYMSISFGDMNCDAKIDYFSSTFGDYTQVDNVPAFAPYTQPKETSRWRYWNGTRFVDSWESTPRVGGLISTPFGWGSTVVDYDNDLDHDIIFHGGLHSGRFVDLNPGAIYQNQGCRGGRNKFNILFERDSEAYQHVEAIGNPFIYNMINSVLAGDMDGDGFNDIVLTSSLGRPENTTWSVYAEDLGVGNGSDRFPIANYTGSAFNVDYGKWQNWTPLDPTDPDPQEFFWNGVEEIPEGRVFLLKNDGDVSHKGNSIRITALGTASLLPHGVVNRNGIGASFVLKPRKNKNKLKKFSTINPIVGGSGYAGQEALAKTVGIKNAEYADIEMRWPTAHGILINELKCVKQGSKILFPEIPCDITHNVCPYGDPLAGYRGYKKCVRTNLKKLRRYNVISAHQQAKLWAGMCHAFMDRHHLPDSHCPPITCA